MAVEIEYIASKTATGRFSEGIEQLPDSPDKTVIGRFSEGIEELPDSPDKTVIGRFSEGIEGAMINRPREEHHHA